MARLVFLGTSSALPLADRTNTMLALLPSAHDGVLVDCGSGVSGALARAGIAPDALGDLIISHAHIDHIGDLPSLIESWRLSGRTRPLRIWAIPEVLDIARRLVALYAFELTLESWPFALSFATLPESGSVTIAGVAVSAARMVHTVPSAGMRFELPAGAIAYSSDTQPNPALVPLARDARLLITEATFPQRATAAARQTRHQSAREAGELAAAVGARALALGHLGRGPTSPAEAARAEAAQVFPGEILILRDGDAIDV